MKFPEIRINVPKLIAAHAHEEDPKFTPREQRAIMAWMGRQKKKKGKGRGGKGGK